MTVKKIMCPMMGSECIEDGKIVGQEIQACRFWIRITGQDPQTGKEIDHFDCTFCWQPILMLENSKMQRQTGAAIETFRNEMVQANDISRILTAQRIPLLKESHGN